MKTPMTFEGEGEGATLPEKVWTRIRRAIADSAWTPLAGKAAAYLAGFALLALVGSGRLAAWMSPSARAAASPIAAASAAELPARHAAPEPPAPAEAPAHGADGGAPGAPNDASDAGAASGVAPDGKVILNLATEDDLRRLPGVGATRARAILALRARLGKFKRPEDLLRVKGIGRRSLARLRPLVRVD